MWAYFGLVSSNNWAPDRPYNDLPAAPSGDNLETRRVLKAAIGARIALAQLDQAVVSVPNPAVLINSIPILEAQATRVNCSPATRKSLWPTDSLMFGEQH